MGRFEIETVDYEEFYEKLGKGGKKILFNLDFGLDEYDEAYVAVVNVTNLDTRVIRFGNTLKLEEFLTADGVEGFDNRNEVCRPILEAITELTN